MVERRRGRMDEKAKEIFITREHIQDLYLAGSKEQFRTLSLHLLFLLSEKEKKIEEWQGKYLDIGEIVQHLRNDNFEMKARIKELESKEIGCKKLIEEFKKINPRLETRIKKLEEGIALLIGFIPDDWEMPLGWNTCVAQARNLIKKE
jgi:hypothetical protein